MNGPAPAQEVSAPMQAHPSEKACTRCGSVKPFGEYYVDSRRTDGRKAQCKACCNTEAETARKHEWKRQNAARQLEYMARWRARNREKILAQTQIKGRVRNGQIVPPKACESCGGGGRIEGHHDNYAKPLEVRWLCSRCHKATHRSLSTDQPTEGE